MNIRSVPCFALFLIVSTSTPAAGETVREYTWLTAGKPSGAMTVRDEGDGSTRVSFHFNDRGRGPETESILRINDAGVPVELEITGKNYLKAAVDERFSAGDGTAAWKSSSESGKATFDGRAFFVASDAPPEMLGTLARAILAGGKEALPLLPTGSASISEVATEVLTAGGAEVRVTLYAITGLDATPEYVWLDEQRQFFGADYGWLGITPKGWESEIGVLKNAQDAATDAFFQDLARRLTENLDDLLVIRGARIFDSIQGKLTGEATVFAWKGRISAIYFTDVAIPAEARVVEAGGKTLMPALWDMHGHVSVGDYLNYLASGVTNVRDMANEPDVIYKLGDDVQAGTIIGPDIQALGFIDRRGEFAAPTGNLADSVEDAVALVDYYAQHGFHGIKLYSSIDPAWVRPIADYAHQRSLDVKGHIPAFMNATQAIENGFDEITHINMVMLNFLGAETLDTRTPIRFTVPGERGQEVNLASREVSDFIELMKDRDIALDPTLSIFMDMFLNEPGNVSPVFRDIADHLPASVRRRSVAGAGRNDGQEAVYAASARRMQELLLLLHQSGIRLLPGTDNDLPGFSLIRELLYYVEAGIPANEALQLATIGAASYMGQGDRLGSVTVGKDAQFYLVDGDPLSDIAALYRVEHVVKGRQMFYAPDMLRAQGFVPFTGTEED